jgi:hypothetical protein
MALVLADRVQETSTTSGTGAFTLDGAVSGYQSFATGIGSGNTVYYAIYDATAFAWETGLGTYTSSPNTLTRTTVFANSLGTTAFISFAGNTTSVFATYPGSKAVSTDTLASPPAIGGTTAAAGTFTTLTGTTSTTTPIVQNSAAAAIAFKTNSATSAVTQFNINHTASAVNYVQVTGAATGGNPAITAQGSDGAINLALSAKSTSSIYFYTNNLSTNSRHLDIIHTGTVVNRFQITGSQTGNPVVLGVNGNDADIDIAFTPKGAGNVRFGTYTGTILTPTGYITIKDSGGTTRRLLVG